MSSDIIFRYAFKKEGNTFWTYYKIRKVQNGFIVEGDKTYPTFGSINKIAKGTSELAQIIALMLDFTEV